MHLGLVDAYLPSFRKVQGNVDEWIYARVQLMGDVHMFVSFVDYSKARLRLHVERHRRQNELRAVKQ